MPLTPDHLRPEQKGATKFIYAADEALLLADVGVGKTVVMLTVLQAWLEQGIISRALIVAPKLVCRTVWPAEIKEWSHMSPRVLNAGVLAGSSPKVRERMVNNLRYTLLLLNYENLAWLMRTFPDGLPGPGKKALVFDEIDKMKNHESKRYKGVKTVKGKGTWEKPERPGYPCLLYTSPSPRDRTRSRMPSSA